MKSLLLVHDQDFLSTARALCYMLTVSGYRVVLSSDLFVRSIKSEAYHDLDRVFTNTAAFLILPSPNLFKNDFLLGIVHDAVGERKAILLSLSSVTNLPPWYTNPIVIDNPGDTSQGLNQLITGLNLFVMNQPPIVTPAIISLRRIN